MWYEILPSCAIITTTFFLPHLFMYHLVKGVTGQVYLKKQTSPILQTFYIRDFRVNNGAWISPKLEDVLPDEPEK